MNATFDSGAKASTSYRNSKNYDSNWISAGYAVWFLREAKFLSQARLTLNTSCAISGTGFFIAADIIEKHRPRFSTTSSPLRSAIRGISASVGPRGSIRYSPITGRGLPKASSPTPRASASPATTCS